MVDAATRSPEGQLWETLSGFLADRSPWFVELRPLLAGLDGRGEAFLFGGSLRDLALRGLDARPRDIDIVFSGVPVDEVRAAVRPYTQRQTRFGGFQLSVKGVEVDLWPLASTWAFGQMALATPSFADLPSTTFLDIEAIVAELPLSTHSRDRIYSRGFFHSLTTRTIEINYEENPYPEFCLARSLDLASRLGFSIGPRLSRFASEWFARLKDEQLADAHRATHGTANCPDCLFQSWRRAIRESVPDRPVPALKRNSGTGHCSRP